MKALQPELKANLLTAFGEEFLLGEWDHDGLHGKGDIYPSFLRHSFNYSGLRARYVDCEVDGFNSPVACWMQNLNRLPAVYAVNLPRSCQF
jgi:hypothetical protein